MADDEFRRVGEDLRALARSLGNDFRSAVDDARRKGHTPGQAVRRAVRDATDEARRGLREGLGGPGGSAGWERPWCGPPWTRGGWCDPWGRGPWARGQRRRGTPWSPPASGSPVPPAGGPGGPFGGGGSGPGAAGDQGSGSVRPAGSWTPPGGPPVGRSKRQVPPVRRRWDSSTVLGMLAVLFGMAWLLTASHVMHASLETVVALGLMLLGASLVITGRTDWSLSRHSWPVWLGAVMILVLVSTSSTLGLGGAAKNVSFGNKSVTAVAGSTVHGGFGNLTVNLPAAASGTFNVASVAGQTFIDVPAGEAVTVNAKVLGGQICVNGINVGNGVAAVYHGIANSSPGVTPSATLDAHQLFGDLIIGPSNQGCHGR